MSHIQNPYDLGLRFEDIGDRRMKYHQNSALFHYLARKLYEESSMDPRSELRLGKLYNSGKGVVKDTEKATQIFKGLEQKYNGDIIGDDASQCLKKKSVSREGHVCRIYRTSRFKKR